MKIITLTYRKMSRKSQTGARYYDRYMDTPWCYLSDCYDKPSSLKLQAFDGVRSTMQKVGGHDLRILYAGCHTFTTGYLVESEGVEYLVVDTKSNRYLIPTC